MVETLGMSQEIYSPDKLLTGPSDQIVSEAITLLSGENRTRGALLGKITLGAVSETHAGNTGNGVLTPDANTPLLANAQVGVYQAVCIAAAGNGGTFRVSDPKGNVLGDIAVGSTFANQIKFVIADGSTDFIVGDTFLITVAAGSLKYKLSLAAAVDGSQEPNAILANDANASAADVATVAYIAGTFNSGAMTFGTGHTAASTKDGLRDKGIFIKTTIA